MHSLFHCHCPWCQVGAWLFWRNVIASLPTLVHHQSHLCCDKSSHNLLLIKALKVATSLPNKLFRSWRNLPTSEYISHLLRHKQCHTRLSRGSVQECHARIIPKLSLSVSIVNIISTDSASQASLVSTAASFITSHTTVSSSMSPQMQPPCTNDADACDAINEALLSCNPAGWQLHFTVIRFLLYYSSVLGFVYFYNLYNTWKKLVR